MWVDVICMLTVKGRVKIRSLQLDNQTLQDELTELKSRAQVLTVELFEN